MMSQAKMGTLVAALIAGIVSSCEQGSQAAQLDPPAAPPSGQTTTNSATSSSHQTALAPLATQPAHPPEGMVYVPGGGFDMGPSQSVTMGNAPRRVQVAPFFLDRTEATVAAYLECVRAQGCTVSKAGEGCNATAKKSRSKHPMNCITKGQAERYCAAQGKRLPSAAEWEFAARGTDGRAYPWGNEAADAQLCWQQPAGGLNENTCPVGSFPAGASPFGALDMAGNVAEWTSTEVTGAAASGAFSTRGGSYLFDPLDRAEPETAKIRADQSEPFADDDAGPTLGARCARDPDRH